MALVFIFFGTLYFLITSPMWQKTITSGQYEDVYIGQSKIDILKQLKSYSYRVERQRVSATSQDRYIDIKKITTTEESTLLKSDVWQTDIIGFKSCSGVSTELNFKSDLLSEIKVTCYRHK